MPKNSDTPVRIYARRYAHPNTDRRRCTLVLSARNDLRLTVLAKARGIDRSTLVNELLERALAGVVVTLHRRQRRGRGQAPPAAAVPPATGAA